MAESDPFSQRKTWDLVAPGYASSSMNHFEHFANEALTIAALRPSERVLDVATGPGSLALLASPQAAEVDALDFSSEMLEQLQRRAQALEVSNVTVHQGDGQRLPFGTDLFDAAFSMFGLMFFPDRDAGFRELRRVLKPNGRCVVASWQPMDELEMFTAIFEALAAELPDLPSGGHDTPLSDAEAIRAEMRSVGFTVTVHEATHAIEAETTEAFWQNMRKAFAPIVLLEHEMGSEAFEPVSAGILRRLVDRVGPGPVAVPMSAWLAEGRC